MTQGFEARLGRRVRALTLSLLAVGLLAPGVLARSVLPQKVMRGVGDEVAPGAASASPSAVLLVDGEEVPADAFGNWLIEEVGPPLVREFAEGLAVARDARARGLALTPEQIEAELGRELALRIDGAFHGQRSEWIEELARLGRSEAGHLAQRRVELEPLLWATALAADGRVVPEEKVLRDWERVHGPRGRSYDLDVLFVQVVVPSGGGSDEFQRERHEAGIVAARAQGQQEALSLRARVLAGEDFAALARAHSDDELTRAAGGRLERFRTVGWPTDFVNALFELERGALSAPLYARGGWWLVRVRDWVDTPLESCRAELERDLVARGPEQDEVGAAWNAVAARTKIEVQPGMLAPPPGDSEDPDPVALLVDGEPVTRRQFAHWLLRTRGEASWQHFTENWLLARRASAAGVTVTKEELEARTREELDLLLERSYKGEREVLRAYLTAARVDEALYMAQLEQRVRWRMLAEKLILAERKVGEEQVAARFEKLYGREGRRVRVRAILLEIPRPDLPPGLPAEEVNARVEEGREARRADAEKLRARALAGEDFTTLARQQSDEPRSRERGGELEGGFQADAWPPQVASAVLALPRGTVSEPLLAGRFWALFEVIDSETVRLEDVRERLLEELRTARPSVPDVAAYRNTMFQAAAVEILPGMTR
jgi:parvulin-like peptidyl-prolyl isomerase